MYPMPEFQERDRGEIVRFVRDHPFAMVSAVDASGRVSATHIPLLVGEEGDRIVLRGHVMRKTEHWSAFHHSSEVLVAFNGPNAPVLASWMDDLAFGGTWNYMAVQMRGRLSFFGEPELIELLRDLKDTYEVDPAAKFDRLPDDYVPKLIKGIEGFRIDVSSFEAVFKLSQNRSPMEFARVVTKLESSGGEPAFVAAEMRARQARFFASTPER